MAELNELFEMATKHMNPTPEFLASRAQRGSISPLSMARDAHRSRRSRADDRSGPQTQAGMSMTADRALRNNGAPNPDPRLERAPR